MKTFKFKALSGLVAAGLMMGAGAASAQVIGGGATLPESLYNTIFTATPLPGFNTYVGTGSGTGKTAFFTNNGALFNAPGATVDYAGSDSLVSETEVSGYDAVAFGPLIQIPSVLTSVTVPYNVTGISSLNLSSEQLALIFSGRVTTWNDNRLGLGLPAAPVRRITVVYRQDSSGTTEIFTRHLNARSATDVPAVNSTFWKALGLSKEAALPSNFVASNSKGTGGSAGVPEVVYSTADSIGYVSPDYTDEGNNALVARVNGLLPTQINPLAVTEMVPVPSTERQRRYPFAWGISNHDPSRGYSIVGSTNLILSQCYQSVTDKLRIRDALNKLYGTAGTWDSQITAHGFIPLSAEWKAAIYQTFYNQADSLELAVGNPAECTPGRGRPL